MKTLYHGLPFTDALAGPDEAQRAEHQPLYLEPGQTSCSDPKLAGGGQIYCQASHPEAYVSS